MMLVRNEVVAARDCVPKRGPELITYRPFHLITAIYRHRFIPHLTIQHFPTHFLSPQDALTQSSTVHPRTDASSLSLSLSLSLS
jgi:hypothetical protein